MTVQNTLLDPSADTAELWLFAAKTAVRPLILAIMALALASCGVRIEPLDFGPERSELTGLVVSDDAQASAAGQTILLNGGTAADAAVAVGSVLAVTVPSRAGFGGGGRCMAVAENGRAEVLDFAPTSASPDRDARWRAGRPILARGLYALHARYGSLAWQQLIMPAENLARFGYTVPPRLAADLAEHGDALSNDRTALSLFLTSDRRLAVAGDRLRNTDLASVFARIRGRGPGGMFAGNLAKEIVDSASAAGASVGIDDLREAVPEWKPAQVMDLGSTRAVIDRPLALEEPLGASPDPADAAVIGTSFVVADQQGLVVTCALSLNAPFGIGLVAKRQGLLFAAAPSDSAQAPVLLTEYTIADRLTYFAGAFASRASARTAHDLAAKGQIEPDQLAQTFAQTGFTCRRGLVDQAKECSVFSVPPGYVTWLLTTEFGGTDSGR